MKRFILILFVALVVLLSQSAWAEKAWWEDDCEACQQLLKLHYSKQDIERFIAISFTIGDPNYLQKVLDDSWARIAATRSPTASTQQKIAATAPIKQAQTTQRVERPSVTFVTAEQAYHPSGKVVDVPPEEP